jgi:beta-galactosidase/beta-glucuronidase
MLPGAGINGDANYMKDEFYAIADELGILLHHEFMLSDTDYTPAVLSSQGQSSDPALSFLPNVRAEAEHQVRKTHAYFNGSPVS